MLKRVWHIEWDSFQFMKEEKTFQRINRVLDMALLTGSIIGFAMAAEFYLNFLK